MDYKIFSFKLDLNKENRLNIKPVQGESAVKLRPTLTQNSQPFNLTDADVRCLFRKPDMTYSYIDAVILDAAKGDIEIELTTQVLLLSGSVVAALEVTGAIGLAKTWLFTMDVQPGMPLTDVLSIDEFPAVDQMLIDVADIKANFNAIVSGVTVDGEVILARSGFTTLGQRMDDISVKVNTTIPAQFADIDLSLAKAPKTDIEAYALLNLPVPQPAKSMRNYILNGDFSNGTGYWAPSSASISSANNVLTNTGLGTAIYPQMVQNTSMPYLEGAKIYIKSKVRVTNSDCTSLKFFMAGGGMPTKFAVLKDNPLNGEYYDGGRIITLTGGISGNMAVYIAHYYATGEMSLNKKMEVQDFIVLNLTTIFGAGNEPSSAQMDSYLTALNPQKWFDGTQDVPIIGVNNNKVFTEVGNDLVFADVNSIINPDLIPISDPLNLFTTDTVGLALKETKELVDNKIGASFDSAFVSADYAADIQDLLPLSSSAKFDYTTSTFSGWGGSLGVVQNFDTLVFRIRNRSANTLPITSIKATITVFDKNGAIVVDRTLSNFNILPGEDITVYFPLGMTVENINADKLWALFQANRLIDVWLGATADSTNLNPPDYGGTVYTVNGSLVAPHIAATVYDPSLTNTKKPLLYVCNLRKTLVPTQEFISNIPALPPPDAVPFYEPVRIILPDFYTCVVGDVFQLFYRGIIEAVNPYIYDIRIAYNGVNTNARNYPRFFQLTPTLEEVGTHTLTITVQTNSGQILATASTQIIVKAVGASLPSPKNILCIGDSLTSGGTWVREGARRILELGGTPVGKGLTNFNFIGTCVNSLMPSVKWEGYGGWTWNSYLAEPSATTLDMWVYCTHDKTIEDQHSLWEDANSNLWQLETIEATRLKFTRYLSHTGQMPVGSGILTQNLNATHIADIVYTSTMAGGGNPFWNENTNQVDFVDYCSRNGFSGIDYVYTLLTWNGQAPYRANAEDNASLIASAKVLIDKIHTQYPNAKVRIMGIQLPSLNGGMGANYGANGGSYSEVYGNIKTVFGINLAYQALANDAMYSGFVEFINLSGQFDSENNMPEMLVQVNTRSTKTEYRGTNGVHPDISGYYQIGDVLYRDVMKTCYE